jgi:hypothetical protein
VLPPANPVGAADYQLKGDISGSEGAYQLTVAIVDATTREHVADATAAFPHATDALGAGDEVVERLGPIADRIRAFQEAHRDVPGSQTAIGARLRLTAAAPLVEVNQSTTLTVEAHDCDGVPLAGRQISLNSDGPGTLSASSVTTDASGHGQVEFRADATAGLANITAVFSYTSVVHRSAMSISWPCVVQVDDPITGYELRLRARKDIVATQDVSRDDPQPFGDFNRVRNSSRSEEHFALGATVWFDAQWEPNALSGTSVIRQSENGTYTFEGRNSALTSDAAAKSYSLGITTRTGGIDPTNPGHYEVDLRGGKFSLTFDAHFTAASKIESITQQTPSTDSDHSFSLPPLPFNLGFDPFLNGGPDVYSAKDRERDAYPFSYTTNSATGDGVASPLVKVRWLVRGMLRPIRRSAAPTALPVGIAQDGNQVSVDYRGGPGAELEFAPDLGGEGVGGARRAGPAGAGPVWTPVGDAEEGDHLGLGTTTGHGFYRLILR